MLDQNWAHLIRRRGDPEAPAASPFMMFGKRRFLFFIHRMTDSSKVSSLGIVRPVRDLRFSFAFVLTVDWIGLNLLASPASAHGLGGPHSEAHLCPPKGVLPCTCYSLTALCNRARTTNFSM